MASRRLHAGIVLAVAGVGLLAWSAGSLRGSPRLAVLCLLGVLPCLLLLWRCVRRLGAPQRMESAAGTLNIEQQSLVDNALALEARLEFAPIALFRIEGASSEGKVTPLNANARKLAAPGRAADPAELYARLASQPAERRATMQFETERGTERALVAVASLSLHGKPQRLAALMPVETELEAEALNAWRQLVHVLTHEIMNSLTPVASLSHTAYELVREAEGLDPVLGADLGTALDAIRRRADSLVAFVASYRSLSNLPEAQPERIRLADMFERVAALVRPLWRARGGDVVFSVEPASMELVADPGQLEQALINLLKNAFEATAEAGEAQARVSARLVRGARLRIEVADNGPGVPEDVAAHIFTPFFTTRKQGGGIGLAMVRHLVHANGGTVRYARPVGKGARFIISF